MCVFFFFFKQKTAYEMRISDWSSDVCSSDLGSRAFPCGCYIISMAVASPWLAGLGPPGEDGAGAKEITGNRAKLSQGIEVGGASYAERSEERRVGKGGVSTGRSRG